MKLANDIISWRHAFRAFVKMVRYLHAFTFPRFHEKSLIKKYFVDFQLFTFFLNLK